MNRAFLKAVEVGMKYKFPYWNDNTIGTLGVTISDMVFDRLNYEMDFASYNDEASNEILVKLMKLSFIFLSRKIELDPENSSEAYMKRASLSQHYSSLLHGIQLDRKDDVISDNYYASIAYSRIDKNEESAKHMRLTISLYLKYTPNLYSVSTTIFIDDQEKGGLSTEMSAFQDLGVLGWGPKTSIINEIGVLKSRTLIENVIKELNLNITFFENGAINNNEIYNDQVPINIRFFVPDSILYNLDTSFVINANSKSKYTITSSDGDVVVSSEFGKNIASSFGEFNITPKDVSKL